PRSTLPNVIAWNDAVINPLASSWPSFEQVTSRSPQPFDTDTVPGVGFTTPTILPLRSNLHIAPAGSVVTLTCCVVPLTMVAQPLTAASATARMMVATNRSESFMRSSSKHSRLSVEKCEPGPFSRHHL